MAATRRRQSFLHITPCCVFLLIAIMSARSSEAETNVLLTGQILTWLNRLSYADTGVSLAMQFDCNLVLYRNGAATWQSNSTGIISRSCYLSFSDDGRLVVRNLFGFELWISSNENCTVGDYVAVLRPEGQVSIYGPAVWSAGTAKESINGSINGDEMISSTRKLENSPLVYNVLFSGEVLYNNGELADNGYSFAITDDCELVLQKTGGEISWRSKTKGNGKDCFARLNHRGQLAVKDDDYAAVWSNKVAANAAAGEYVLVMQRNGDAVIYGPEVWSTADSKSGFLQMPAGEK